jgi:hypothetical protein
MKTLFTLGTTPFSIFVRLICASVESNQQFYTTVAAIAIPYRLWILDLNWALSVTTLVFAEDLTREQQCTLAFVGTRHH